ncbi:glycosyltransferase domain-containing protein [Lachnospiraceae bacterium C1.1]|nr:DUF616 domain-containing protein [Lachnospiraceae bacterium C1.1]
MRVGLFGAGRIGISFLNDYIKKYGYIGDIACFIDNNSDKVGGAIDGIPIISVDKAAELDIDLYVICSQFELEIRKQLNVRGIEDTCIKNHFAFKRMKYSLEKYVLQYGKNKCGGDGIKCDSLVVYTAITGGYDVLNIPLYRDDKITYVCFSNDRNLKSDFWNIEYIEDPNINNIMLSKRFKIHPERYFKEYEISVWVDGKFLIRDDLRRYINKYIKKSPILCFPHPERNCIYDEAACCIAEHKGVKKDLVRQISHYYNGGYPFDAGLFEMGCIVRNHNDENVIRLMNAWEEEIIKYSYRDQISFPYVCWKMNLYPDISDLDINDNDYLFMNRFLLREEKSGNTK